MGMILGFDGRNRALAASMGGSASALPSLYLGLLSASPLTHIDKDLGDLLIACPELPVSASFYSGRKLITFTNPLSDLDGGSYVSNDNSSPIVWSNTSGSPINVGGLMITTSASGSGGLVLWLGVPEVGAVTVPDGGTATFEAGQIKASLK